MQLPPTNALIQALSRLAPDAQPRVKPSPATPSVQARGVPAGEPAGPVARSAEMGRHLPRGSLVDITV